MATTTLSAPMSAPRATNPWFLATTVPLAAFMEFLDITIVNVAVEHIAGNLSSSIDEASYILTSYLVANVPDSYESDCRQTASLVAAEVNDILSGNDWYFSFQSQGMSGGPWIGPTVEETLAH